jgi:hypothetical protein
MSLHRVAPWMAIKAAANNQTDETPLSGTEDDSSIK